MTTPDPKGFPKASASERIDTTHQKGSERWEYKTSRFHGQRGTRLEILVTKGVHQEIADLLKAWRP